MVDSKRKPEEENARRVNTMGRLAAAHVGDRLRGMAARNVALDKSTVIPQYAAMRYGQKWKKMLM